MASLDIRINIPKLKHYSDKLKFKIDEETSLTLIELFSEYVRRSYLDAIEKSINSRRYNGRWEPKEEEGYREYLGIEPSKVPIFSMIKESMEIKRIGYNYIIRINPRYNYPGTSIPLITVLRSIDSGTSKFNARPLFKKITRDFNYNILSMWKNYLALGGII